MELSALIATGFSTGLISVPLAAYLGKTWVENQLRKEQSLLDARIRQQVESVLAEQAAQRQYDWDARKRLYEAIGPLRFQLLLSCRDLAGRIQAHGMHEHYDTDVSTYYGRSTLYRLIRPITIGLLIERQMAYADFAVDPATVKLLRFSFLVRQCLSAEFLVAGHSQIDWDHQRQHVFSEMVSTAATGLVVNEGERGERVMRFDEFEGCLRKHQAKLDPFPTLLADFSPVAKPLLWLRMVGYAKVCQQFITDHGSSVGFEVRDLPVKTLLEITRDPEICQNIDVYTARCDDILKLPY